ncbi:atrial natriuretic peptide receptor 2-like [Liolophura sinensis]|uniref:atrial natriuretic peptide receptor 2-like n=1 Tax=Liolophura sinensis TaxID=3198878 RepID=UPI0031590D1F
MPDQGRVVCRVLVVMVSLNFSVIGLLADTVHIRGAGASFPYDVYSSWISAYVAHRQTHVKLNMTYVSTGSGEGKARIKGVSVSGEPVDYAGSDSVLSEQDYHQYPDLQMFPVMAGPIVVAFNVPGLKSLVLDTIHLAAIYSGEITRWNDSVLQHLNPEVVLPAEHIVVIARSDKSGTTETFTAALSAVSRSWKENYGSFSSGLDKNDIPVRWNASVVTSFARTNRGMAGMLLSQKFSVGYMSIASATDAKLPFAALVNSAGNAVVASIETVQNAMNDFAKTIDARLTVPLINAPGKFSYPIAATTYFIIYLQSMKDCRVAAELMRYIEWFLRDKMARNLCESLGMVPLPEEMVGMIEERALRKMTCDGKNVYNMMLEQRREESSEPDLLTTPIIIVSVALGVGLFIWLLNFLRPYLRRRLALIRNEWKIDSESIALHSDGSRFGSASSRRRRSQSASLSFSMNSSVNNITSGLYGKWNGHRVVLKHSCIPSIESVSNVKLRRYLLWIRDVVKHENVTKFYGMTSLEFTSYLVIEMCPKGSLRDFLGDSRFNLDENFKYSMALKVARGMSYLHSIGILHGYLKAANCYIDEKWTLKISVWEKQTLTSMIQGSWLDVKEENAWTRAAYWHAPELLATQSGGKLTKATDVYSFSVVLQEIFTCNDPYVELKDDMTPEGVVEAIMTSALRPVFTPDTPAPVRDIMNKAWSMDIKERPSFLQLEKMINEANPHRETVVDSMLTNLEKCLAEVEQRLEDKTSELEASMKRTESMLRKAMPSSVVSSLLNGHALSPADMNSVSVLVLTVSGICRMVSKLPAAQAANHVSKVCHELDNVAESYSGMLKLESLPDVHIVVSGLPDQPREHAVIVASVAFEFQRAVKRVQSQLTSFEGVGLRIGIHSGATVATVIGKFSPKYCVLGETVNLAWKLSYLCKLWKVLVSEEVCNQLVNVNKYSRTAAGSLKEGSRTLRTYWLEEKTF